ncbi:type I polyketide synthase [Micromonospora sp. NBC_01796]|uniref:type I polyketide synthase n=1 Tax=Micromonospora sp. NBC_01796 TaxID=2975987 RepID=UPI002DDB59B3|nr:type I polyketide synthase [Micromonospora sp. NBC_01796]WSA86651.1 type I polyketide synthase [Micromonospora sp. NBC_01796]
MPAPSSPEQPPSGDDLLTRLLLEKYEPIAIVGIGLRMPGGNDTRESFADFLRAGSDGIGPIPPDRWDVDNFATTEPSARGKIRTAGGGFLDGVDQFDPAFFGISPKEAGYVDPQQRLVLETAWAALEDAGLDADALRGANGGVYVGISSADYMVAAGALPDEAIDGYLGAGTSHSAAAGRLSYFLGWQGPCASVDTACSSSLVALDMAVRDLRQRQCDIALAGGVNLAIHPQAHIVTTQANMLAPDGRCKTFDDSADGYARSEGSGMLALKRLSDARRDGDRVLALVRGCAIRQDGESGGLTVPNGGAQQRVMRAALANSALTPGDIQYVEAHGTGTAVGDPIEVAAIASVFADSHTRQAPLLVASVKTNIGHSEPAAGVSGVIKTVLQLGEGRVYPHLNLRTPSTRIAWDEIPVAVPTRAERWPAAGVRRAMVNSFGFAGTIASTVLEQAPEFTDVRPGDDPPGTGDPVDPDVHVFTLSAKTRRALGLQVERYQHLLDQRPDLDPARLCHAANVSRTHLPVRLAGAVSTRADLTNLLARPAAEPRHLRQVAFLFSGQGSQYPGMGRELYRRHRSFAATVDECDGLFAPYLDGRSVAALMFGTDPDAADLLDQTRYTQPALFTLEYALAAMWASWGIRPDVVLGHSIGEVAAGAVAGIFALPDAVRLVATRARLMQSVRTPGGMVAVRAPAEELGALLAGRTDLSLAAHNGPDQCVVSGALDALDGFGAQLADRGLRVKRLPVSHAFHSPLMDEVLDEFRTALDGMRFAEPEITLISNLAGEVATPEAVRDPDYWVRLIREPVLFADGVRAIAARGAHAMLEIGPARTLVNTARTCVPAAEHQWLGSLERDDERARASRETVAALYTSGLPVSWSGFHDGRPRPHLTLPGYRFDRRRYWMPPARSIGSAATAHPLLGTERSTAEQLSRGEREFAGTVGPDSPRYLTDHVVGDQVVFPVAGFIEVVVAGLDAVHGEVTRPVRDLRVHEPLLLGEGACTLITRIRPGADGGDEIEVLSSADQSGPERRHITATATASGAVDTELLGHGTRLRTESDSVTGAEPEALARVDTLYANLAASGLHYGPEFRRVRSLTPYGEEIAVADLAGPGGVPAEHLPPPILDSALQTTLLDWTLRADSAGQGPGLPVRLGSFQLFSRPRGRRLRSVVRLVPTDPASGIDAVATVVLSDGDRVVCVLHDLEFRRINQASTARRRLFHRASWVERPLPATGVEPPHAVLVHARTKPAARTGTGDTGTRISFADDLTELPDLLAQRPSDVFWCWQPDDADTSAGLAQQCRRQYTRLLDLVRLLEQHGFGPDQRLWLVTSGAQWLPGDDPGDERRLTSATVWGFGAVLANEYPNYRVTLLDLPPGTAPAPEVLLAESRAGEPEELQVAYRDGRRYTRRIEVHEPDARQVGAPVVDPDHTYLITGGMGGLGLAAARTLVDLGARHLALVGRRVPDPAALAAIRTDLGPQVSVRAYAADIARPDDVETLFKALPEDGPPLGGLVHAAGVLADRPVTALRWEDFETVFQAKVYGSWLLHQATAKLPGLRFFVGYSSSSSVFGQAGQANYAAGNAFLDALMHSRVAQGLPGVAVDWGPWTDIGMAAGLSEQRRASFTQQGIGFIQPSDGHRALATLLTGPTPPQVIVGESDWTTFAATRPLPNALYELVARRAAHTVRTVDTEALRVLPAAERTALLVELVRDTVAEVLHYDTSDEIPLDTRFTNLGLDSLAAVEVKNKLESALRIPLPVSVTLDHPAADLLAVFLAGTVADDPSIDATAGVPSGTNLDDADAQLAALKELGA